VEVVAAPSGTHAKCTSEAHSCAITPLETLQMADSDPSSYVKEVGAAFRLGSGVLGKSAIAIGLFIVVGGIALFRLHSDEAILGALVVIALGFFLWFFPVLRFVERNPDAGLLDGSEWTGFKRFQASAKGYIPDTSNPEPTTPTGTDFAVTVIAPKKPEVEDQPNG
jgi:hypothetical protein